MKLLYVLGWNMKKNCCMASSAIEYHTQSHLTTWSNYDLKCQMQKESMFKKYFIAQIILY